MLIKFVSILFTVFLINVSTVFSQNLKSDSTSVDKNISIIEVYGIDKLVELHKNYYALKGYRIQIFSGNKRQPAKNEKSKFINLYRKVKAYEVYQQPYFKVRVGNFKTKLEALKFQQELLKYFPNCFIVEDDLDYENM